MDHSIEARQKEEQTHTGTVWIVEVLRLGRGLDGLDHLLGVVQGVVEGEVLAILVGLQNRGLPADREISDIEIVGYRDGCGIQETISTGLSEDDSINESKVYRDKSRCRP